MYAATTNSTTREHTGLRGENRRSRVPLATRAGRCRHTTPHAWAGGTSSAEPRGRRAKAPPATTRCVCRGAEGQPMGTLMKVHGGVGGKAARPHWQAHSLDHQDTHVLRAAADARSRPRDAGSQDVAPADHRGGDDERRRQPGHRQRKRKASRTRMAVSPSSSPSSTRNFSARAIVRCETVCSSRTQSHPASLQSFPRTRCVATPF